MVKRRKMLIGLGSLAAGGAAAMGTGAFSQSESPRAMDVAVVNDNDGLLGLNLSDSSLENTEYASYEDGQLRLHFDSNADVSNGGLWEGDGLNPDSTFDFDNVFQIRNQSADNLKVSIDKSGLDHPDDITFYGSSMAGNVYNRNSDWNGQVNAGYGVNIGVRIETPEWTNENWETGHIVIEAYDPDDTNTP